MTTLNGRHQHGCVQCMPVLPTTPCALVMCLSSVHASGSVGMITIQSRVYAHSRSAMR